MTQPALPDPVLIPRPAPAALECPSCYQSPNHLQAWRCQECDAPHSPHDQGSSCSGCGSEWTEVPCPSCEAWSPRAEWTARLEPWQRWTARVLGLIAGLAAPALLMVTMPRPLGDPSLSELLAALTIYAMGGAYFLTAGVVRAALQGDLGDRRRGRGAVSYWGPVLLAGILPSAAIHFGWGWASVPLIPLPFLLQHFALRELDRETCPREVLELRESRARAARFARPQEPLG